MGDGTFTATMTARSSASPASVYDLLADIGSHLVWAGEQQDKRYRLTSIEAPGGQAAVGTAWTSTGLVPMSRAHWEDRSTVITAERPRLFEFITEGRVAVRKPMTATFLNRYLITPDGEGCRVTHQLRVVEVINPMLRLRYPMRIAVLKFGVPLSSGRGLRNLLRMAELREASSVADSAGGVVIPAG